ncbi:TRAP transporter large permease [Desulfobacula sp.]|uniref:TRAP transporter large permease n=1 Tax=Desulfobacula sp. TaxID=2593537 RepID=UPI00260E6AAC|nr:TRAP transporter large permease [Desulfobacula sp.]
MSPVLIGIIAFVVLFSLLAFGVPIGAGMALVGFTGLWFLISDVAAFTKLAVVPFQTITDYSLAVLPLFLLMAQVVFVSGMGRDLFNLASKLLGHRRGGVAMAAVAGSGIFAAVSASSIATATTMGLVSIPEMQRLKYNPALATGAVAAGGTMGVLIPPSGALIIYGILTETSIGKLFAAGVIPGILEALFYIAVIAILCWWKPNWGPRAEKAPFSERIKAFSKCGEMIVLIVFVLSGLIIGWFTPTEAGAVGAFGAIIMCLVRGRLNWEKFKQAIMATLKTTGMIYGILIGALIFNYLVAASTIPYVLADTIGGLPLPPYAILALVLVLYFFLGCFLDVAAMTVLTIPIFFPMVMELGFNPIWFGIIFVRMAEIAMITPPIGMNTFVIAGIAREMGIDMTTVFKGILPFLIADFLHLFLLILFPGISLYLVSILM